MFFKKCVEMENNQLKYGDHFHFMSRAGDNKKQINYRWPYCSIVLELSK